MLSVMDSEERKGLGRSHRGVPVADAVERGQPAQRAGSDCHPRIYTGFRRWLLLGFAGLCLALAFIGVWVPGMPTTIFVLMAAWAAMRSSPRLHAWLESHRLFGPMLRHWRLYRAVSRRAKWAATGTMAFCAVLCFLTVPKRWMAWLGTSIMATVAVWLWFRPEPPVRDLDMPAGPRSAASE